MESRLQKIIAEAGIASRRRAEELILAGRVEVDGKVVRTLGSKPVDVLMRSTELSRAMMANGMLAGLVAITPGAGFVGPMGAIAIGLLAGVVCFAALQIKFMFNFDDALEIVRELGAAGGGVEIVNSINPHRIAGQATAAHEIVADLGDAPDVLALPVGNAGNISAYWRGFTDAAAAGASAKRPRMIGVQAAGAAPLVSGAPIANPETVATAIRIGKPASWETAVAARDESGGFIRAVTDDEIFGTRERKRVGETWPINSEVAARALGEAFRQPRRDDQVRGVIDVLGLIVIKLVGRHNANNR